MAEKPKRKTAGRKRKLNQEMIERAERLSSEFRTDKDIYEALGISHESFYVWKNEGANPECTDPLIVAFSAALKRGRAVWRENLERDCIARIQAAEAWQSDAWLLERTMPEQYGRVDRLQAEVHGNATAAVAVTHYFNYDDEPETDAEE